MHRCVIINDSEDKEELTVEKKIQMLEKSFCFKKSRMLDKHPSDIGSLCFGKEYPLIFNDRIYFIKSPEHREIVAKNPLKYLMESAPPHDINMNLSMWLIGKSFCGKSSMAKEMGKELGVIQLRTKDIINHFLNNPFDIQSKLLRQCLRRGENVPDDL